MGVFEMLVMDNFVLLIAIVKMETKCEIPLAKQAKKNSFTVYV